MLHQFVTQQRFRCVGRVRQGQLWYRPALSRLDVPGQFRPSGLLQALRLSKRAVERQRKVVGVIDLRGPRREATAEDDGVRTVDRVVGAAATGVADGEMEGSLVAEAAAELGM